MDISRRSLLALTGASMARRSKAGAPVSIFDGKTLDGWIQIENSATAFSGAGITDAAGLEDHLLHGSDPVALLLRARLNLTHDSNPKALTSALVAGLNQIVSGPPIYDRAVFAKVALRAETEQLLRRNPGGQQLARLNKLLLEDAFPRDLTMSASTGWVVKDGAMASTGAGRGVIYTAKDYGRFRLAFTMRHVSGNPDHQACFLIFCTRPKAGEKPPDALGGIQFQPPNGGRWDYRPGMNNNGGAEFTKINTTHFDPHEWSRVEIVADAGQGSARMKVAQPLGSESVEVLAFQDPSAGKVGPIAWQMHNAGLFDEYKDVTVEEM